MVGLRIGIGFVVGVAVLALLQRLNTAARRRLMVVVTFLSGLFYVLEFVLPPGLALPGMPLANPERDNFLSPYVETLGSVVLVIGGFAFGLGLLNLMTIHGRTLIHRRPGWINSAAFYVALILMLIAGLFRGKEGALSTLYRLLFEGLYQPLGASVFSILAFFITTAAYRAFRVRSGEATLMMVAAFIVMMAQVPLGMMMTNWLPSTGAWSNLRIENVSNWLMTVLNMAALRAVGFGIGVGGLAMSLRVWLSLEKGTYFGKEM
ncbi:MAG: hypothetical protein QHJ73_00870 [Armatimonadota bacterium]|nr:hypothetical protein [Armatimonadota bacterium]